MSSLTVTAALCPTMRCIYVCMCVNVFPDSNGSVVSDYEVWLNDKSSDYAVQEVLADYVANNNGKLGNFTVTVASSECCTYAVMKKFRMLLVWGVVPF